MGVMSQWERVFVFTEGGNLLMCRRGETAGCLLAELDHSTLCQPLGNDDRASVFQISTSKKWVARGWGLVGWKGWCGVF